MGATLGELPVPKAISAMASGQVDADEAANKRPPTSLRSRIRSGEAEMTSVTQRPPAAEPEPTNRAPRNKSTLRGQENRAGIVLVSPTLVIVLVVVVLPILWTIVLAFQNVRLVNIQSQGLFGHWTLRNLDRVFSSPGFWSSLWTTVVYTIGSTLGSILVGLIAALALRKPFRGRALVRGAMLLPYVAPVVAVAFVWQVLLSPDLGVVNHWGINVFGWDRPIAFLTQRSYDWPAYRYRWLCSP